MGGWSDVASWGRGDPWVLTCTVLAKAFERTEDSRCFKMTARTRPPSLPISCPHDTINLGGIIRAFIFQRLFTPLRCVHLKMARESARRDSAHLDFHPGAKSTGNGGVPPSLIYYQRGIVKSRPMPLLLQQPFCTPYRILILTHDQNLHIYIRLSLLYFLQPLADRNSTTERPLLHDDRWPIGTQRLNDPFSTMIVGRSESNNSTIPYLQ